MLVVCITRIVLQNAAMVLQATWIIVQDILIAPHLRGIVIQDTWVVLHVTWILHVDLLQVAWIVLQKKLDCIAGYIDCIA